MSADAAPLAVSLESAVVLGVLRLQGDGEQAGNPRPVERAAIPRGKGGVGQVVQPRYLRRNLRPAAAGVGRRYRRLSLVAAVEQRRSSPREHGPSAAE